MATCITVAMRKGGVGKTATVANLAGLMALEGKKVLVVDTDSQGNCTDLMTGFDVFSERFKNAGIFEMFRFYGGLPTEKFITHTNVENVDIIPANGMSAKTSSQIAILSESGDLSKNLYLADSLSQISDRYDYIVIDTAPGDDLLFHNALIASDYVLVPCKIDDYSESSLSWTFATCKIIEKEENAEINILGIFYTLVEKVTQVKLIREKISQSKYAGYIMNTEIRKNQAANDMTTYKLPAVICAKSSNVAKDYTALWAEIKKRIRKLERA